MAFRHVISDSDGKLRRNLGKSIVTPSTEIVVPSPSIFRKGLGQSSPVETIQYADSPKTSAIRKGLGKNMQSVTGSVAPQTINVPYVADGNYRGVFYQIGTELESIAYANPSTKQNAFKVNTSFESSLSLSQTLTPERIFVRPSNFSSSRNPQHTADGDSYFWITLPSGFWLKPSGIVIQSRTDFDGFHLTNFTLRGCSNTSSTENRIDTIGSYSTGFTGAGQFYVNTGISSSFYYNSFKIQRDANSTTGTYLTMAFLELYGDLKIYNI